MDGKRIRQTGIQWLPWELHPQRPRKKGGRGKKKKREKEVKEKEENKTWNVK